MATKPSLLDDLGEEVTGIVTPVSLCMAVTVLLVRLLNPEGSSSPSSVVIASIAYHENASDSSGKKLGGALLNAIIFVAVIAGMTVLLLLLFKYKCYKFIYAYMGFAVFNIFFFLTGALFIQVMQVINLHIDAFSLAYGLLNFSVIGTLGLLFMPIPLLMKQLYLIWVGIIVAYVFTWIPEWTSWVILVFMALYDIAAVLIPGGPLQALVKLAIERNQDLPALVYEARPAGGRPYVRGWGNRARAAQQEGEGGAGDATQRPVAEGAATPAGAATRAPNSVEMRRPGSRESGGASPPLTASDGGSPTARRGSGGVPMNGGWVTGPSRAVLTVPESASLPCGGGELEGGDTGPAGDDVRSFGSQCDPDQQQQQQQQARRGTGPGPRAVAEGLETEDEGWEQLLSRDASVAQGDSRGGGDRINTRLSRVLSGSRRASANTGDFSHTSQEPLIDPPSSSEGPAGQQQRQPQLSNNQLQPRLSGAVPADGIPHRHWAGGDSAGAGSPAAATSPRRGGGSYDPALRPAAGSGAFRSSTGSNVGIESGRKGSPLQQQQQQQLDSSTMGVRPVAPALSEEQLAEAVRRSIRSLGEPGQQPPPPSLGVVTSPAPPPPPPPDGERRGHDGEAGEEAFEHDLPDAIKLGLGDFIFYSLLVGRAAMYDFMTVFSSYLAIIAGLGLTLLCLAIYQKALPALPFSIAMGVAFYFLTRFTLEPFLVPMAAHLAYY
ncbi:hypothetical protein Vretifemale_12242 [Volvox reticuliferus]|uniref:Presenilin n=1 Tax=Volvox reticuliferus TaxID=1737510 RepID=A0A8J4CR01_9CHLO|nr:hypothetical protein Vretifemale_12242 [Volvox reticuliferus]